MIDTSLGERAAALGIGTVYHDTWGNEHVVPEATVRRFVEILGSEAPRADRRLDFVTVWYEDEPQRLAVRYHDRDGDLPFTCLQEDGARVDGTFRRAEGAHATLPFTLRQGYHRLEMDGEATTLIVAPRRAHLPQGGMTERLWGLAVQLYALRSERNWGIGDFTDLATLIGIARDAGAASVGLNPLHALALDIPEAASPYSPTSRLFLNWLYIDPEAIEEVRADPAIAEPPFRERLRALRASAVVDYAGVAAAKGEVLERAYERFRATALDTAQPAESGSAFRAWFEGGGETLLDFVTYEALREHFARERPGGWTQWPREYHDARGPAVAAFRERAKDRVDYHAWVQWHAQRQFARCADEASSMAVGIYRDLAVGVDTSSADVWLDRDAYVCDVSVGAPPDELNRQGQDWGLPPIDPQALRHSGYATLAQLLRANMQYAGALRIDHAMSLMRLFWIPRGAPASDGAYVAYPFEEMLAVLALESTRARCMVIGEDLGTVPPGFRERMAEANVLSYRLLFFERHADGSFNRPDEYPALALVTAGTHDLATLPGYLVARDVDARARLGMTKVAGDPGPDYDERVRDRRLLLGALVDAGTLGAQNAENLPWRADGEARTDAFDGAVLAAYRFLARTPGMLEMISLDELVGELDQINLPGTTDAYPNWRRKLGGNIENLREDHRLLALREALREGGR